MFYLLLSAMYLSIGVPFNSVVQQVVVARFSRLIDFLLLWSIHTCNSYKHTENDTRYVQSEWRVSEQKTTVAFSHFSLFVILFCVSSFLFRPNVLPPPPLSLFLCHADVMPSLISLLDHFIYYIEKRVKCFTTELNVYTAKKKWKKREGHKICTISSSVHKYIKHIQHHAVD